MSNEKTHTYIEKERVVEESNCKWMKRNIVGMILFIKEWSEQNDVLIPEDYFDNIPDNIGFSVDFEMDDESGEDLRSFRIVENWKVAKDDCGGTEEICNFEEIYFTGTAEKRKLHLKLAVDNEESKQ
jgi:hypothetical protein